MSEVLYEERGSVALVTLNRPDSLNAFNARQRLELVRALDRAERAPAVRVVVLAGMGRGFSAGADLKDNFPTPETVLHQLGHEYNPGILALSRMDKPCIATVQGFASGIGISYVLACDLVVMGDGAFLQLPFARIALVPDGGLCWQLVERLGPRRAFEYAVTGERIPAAKCLELGLANRLAPDPTVLEAALRWAQQLTECAPLALAATKRLLRAATALGLEGTMRAEAEAQATCIATSDFAEGVSSFLEKRAPRFTGR